MLEVRGLTASFGSFTLKDISFRAEANDYTVLLGPCGAGKTKLLEVISGVAPHSSGQVFVDERDMTKRPPETRHIGLIYQKGYLFPHLSIKKNIAYGLQYVSISDEEKRERMRWIIDLLDIYYLMRRSSPRNLSGGEQQKIILARALILKPSLLLMDEPFASLDFSSREELFSAFKILQQEHDITILHVTHDREEASVLSDRILFLWNGRLLQQSSFQDLISSPKSYEVVRFLGLKSILSGTVKNGTFAARRCDETFTLPAPGRPDGPGYVYIPADAVSLEPGGTKSELKNTDTVRISGRLRLLLERDGRIMAEVQLGKQTLTAPLSKEESETVRLGDTVTCLVSLSGIVFLDTSL